MIEFYSILNKPLEIVLEVFATVTLEARIERERERVKVERHRRRFSISKSHQLGPRVEFEFE